MGIRGQSVLFSEDRFFFSILLRRFHFIQGTVMEKAFGFIDAASMNNADAISVLFFGYVVGTFLYPTLAKREIRIHLGYLLARCDNDLIIGVSSVG